MCFGGGGGKAYDAYSSGNFGNWKQLFDQKAAIQTAIATGKMDKAAGEKKIAALTPQLTSLESQIKRDPSGGMEMREVSRQNDVGLGRIGIDKAFAKFNPNYYDKYKGDYENYYNPQLEDQYKDIVDKTTASLADRGVLESSIANNDMAKLTKEKADARTNISNEARDAANKLRGTVENSKSSLYNLNEASANPQTVNAQALGSATALVAPPQYSPLGQVFASAANALANYASARRNAPGRSYTSRYPTGSGSSTVIG